MKPQIALVITDRESNAQIKPLGVALLELRIDLFKKINPDYVSAQIKSRRVLKIPLLLTVRNQKKEGAVKEISDAVKWDILQAGLPVVDMVDIELSSPLLRATIKLAHQHCKKVIVSIHDFEHTPANLENIFKKALSARADIVKIAAKANTADDVCQMIDFTRKHKKHPLITMSLGSIGSISRVILPLVGSLYTYSFLKTPTAPGQIDVKTLASHLKFYYP